MKEIHKIDKSTLIDENSKLTGKIKIGKNCIIKNSNLNNCTIGDNVEIIDSYIDGAEIKNNVRIGPYSRIRPFTVISEDVKIGNFVEIKNSVIGKRTKIPHLSYVGDCEVGEDVNIGCGVIFCNYDGFNKTKTFVGNRVFIGSNSNIVAPVIIEDESFIAAGTTITENVENNKFAIGRPKFEKKDGVYNPYLQNFQKDLKYFGTDGIRGIYGEKLTDELCIKVGYALTRLKSNPKILIGRDTRPSGNVMLEKISQGILSGGGKVYSVGVISTAGLAFLTKQFDFDYGIELTASHNPSEYNGIKIFNKNGYKLNENQEILIEKHLKMPKKCKNYKILDFSKTEYLESLERVCTEKLSGLKIFLDCSSGAVSSYAKQIFENLGAKVCAIHTSGEINKDTSVLDENLFVKNMKQSKCDIGFCFDGDADRVMCITKNLKVLDGDKILYMLSKYRKEKYAVGTIMTNLAIEKHLKNIGTRLIRTNVGDKYIARIMKSKHYNIGAEVSGHVIISELSTTGDGVLTALYLLGIFKHNKQLFYEAENLKIYPTVSKKVKTENKGILKDSFITEKINNLQKSLNSNGRVIVRPSGTEPVIRITVECKSLEKAELVANEILKTIEERLKI